MSLYFWVWRWEWFRNAIRLYGATIQMKATEQCFPVVLYFIMLHKVFLMFESVDETLKCYHSNESYWAVLSCGTVCYAVQDTCFKLVCRYLSLSLVVTAMTWKKKENYWFLPFVGFLILYKLLFETFSSSCRWSEIFCKKQVLKVQLSRWHWWGFS